MYKHVIWIVLFNLVVYFPQVGGSRRELNLEQQIPKKCQIWTPRERRHPECISGLQNLIDSLSIGTFTGEGRYNKEKDFAPERDWVPEDDKSRQLFQRYSAYPPTAGVSCLQGHSVFFVGSSFMRQIVLDFVKYLNGTRQQEYSQVERGFEEVPSSPRICCPDTSQYKLGICHPDHHFHPWDPARNITCKNCNDRMEGVDIENAGCLPGRRLWSSHWFHLQYQFSTYLWQRELMDVWIPELRKVRSAPRPALSGQEKSKLIRGSYYQVLVIQAGVWEEMKLFSNGQDTGLPTDWLRNFYKLQEGDTHESILRQAVQLYIQYIKNHFGGTIVWLLEPNENRYNPAVNVISEEVRRPQHKFLIVEKEPYIRVGKREHVRPIQHGWAGPISDTVSKVLLSLFCNHIAA